MELKVYNQNGEEAGKVKLPESVFGLPFNTELIHQVVVSMQANSRKTIAHAKGRGEVRGGGKKPWRQKGTGRARHGSSRSPIWIGGGVTHGPLKEKDYSKKINKKMKIKALYTALSAKARDGEILILDDLNISQPKTKETHKIVSNLSKIKGFEKLGFKRQNRAMFLIKDPDKNLNRAFRNLPGVMVGEARNLNTLSALTYKYLIFLKSSLAAFK